jgi:acylphosphatase
MCGARGGAGQAMVTEQIHFSGRVQGVGFRWTTQRLARGLSLTGWVRNLADGRVEARVTGAGEDIEALLRRLNGHFGAGLAGVERLRCPDLDEFEGFEIRR